MPTEHEYKYVIAPGLLEQHPEANLRVTCQKHLIIEQGYLAFSKGYSSRIRKVTEFGKTRWFHTLKQKVTTRVVEVEKKLDDRDGADLWPCCVGKLKKDRYVFPHDGNIWELDLFKQDGSVYFILAEVEVSEGAPRPKTIPELFRDHVLLAVPLDDDRFSNKRLGDHIHAKALYKQVQADTSKVTA
jgi:CYTH domain-containing protein